MVPRKGSPYCWAPGISSAARSPTAREMACMLTSTQAVQCITAVSSSEPLSRTSRSTRTARPQARVLLPAVVHPRAIRYKRHRHAVPRTEYTNAGCDGRLTRALLHWIGLEPYIRILEQRGFRLNYR